MLVCQHLIYAFIYSHFLLFRSSEFVAVAAIVCTLFLFLHTQSLTTKLHEMENRLQPSALNSDNEYSGNKTKNCTLIA